MNSLREDLAELWRFRGLLGVLVRRDLKVRYKNSRLGFLWSIAPPLMQVAVISFAFRYATNFAQGFSNYTAFVLVAIIPWTYFQTALLDSSQSILLMGGVIKKVYLPREIIPLSGAISNFIHFLMSWLVFFVYWWVFRHGPLNWPLILWFPYLLLCQFMLVTGLCLLVSCLNVFYEDIKFILTIVLQLFLFLLPIMYVVENVTNNPRFRDRPWLLHLYQLNPLATLITGYRRAVLEPLPVSVRGTASTSFDAPSLLLVGLISFLVLVGSYMYFNSRKWQFVERP